jgi:hypothetical protein
MPDQTTNDENGSNDNVFERSELLRYMAALNTLDFSRRIDALDSALQYWFEQYTPDEIAGLVRLLALRRRQPKSVD